MKTDGDSVIQQVKSGDLNLVTVLNSWLDDLDKKKVSSATQKLYYAAVKKFFEINVEDLHVNWKMVDLPKLWRVEEDEVPSREIFKKILNYCTLFDRTLITFKASSGARDITLAGLNVGDVDLDTYEDVGVVKVRAEIAKDRIKYATFITPEAKKMLREYFAMRERKGEKITEDSPLFINPKTTEPRRLSKKTLSQRWRRLLKKSGLDLKPRKHFKLRFHTLKKFFSTTLEISGVSTSFKERMLGHKGGYLDDAYFKPVLEQMLNEYRKAIPSLTIMEEVQYETIRKRQLLDTAKLLGFDEERLKRLEEVMARAKNIDEALEGFRKLKDKDFQESNNGSFINGNGYRAKIIEETELIKHVEQDWEIVKELADGKFIMRKQNH
jgi:integrase